MLPAWIREGLEKMEREKAKKEEKERRDKEKLEAKLLREKAEEEAENALRKEAEEKGIVLMPRKSRFVSRCLEEKTNLVMAIVFQLFL